MEEKQRTLQQNKALHVLFERLAKELNDAGFDMKKTLSPEIDIPWSAYTVKEHLWKPIQLSQVGKGSTADLSTKDIDKVFETLNRYLGSNLGMHINFPSIEDILLEQASKEQ